MKITYNIFNEVFLVYSLKLSMIVVQKRFIFVVEKIIGMSRGLGRSF